MAARLKEAQLPIVQAIALLPSMSLLWRDGAEALLSEVSTDLQPDAPPARLNSSVLPVLSLLLDISEQSPETLGAAGGVLCEALQAAAKSGSGIGVDAGRRPALVLLLRLVHAVSAQLAQAAPATRKSLVGVLCALCCAAKDDEVGKLAAQALSTRLLVPINRDRTFEMLMTKLRPALEPSRPTAAQHCALSVIGALGKREPRALGADRAAMLGKLREMALPPANDTTMGQDEDAGAQAAALPAPQLRARCTSQLLAIKALANEALGSSSLVRPAAAPTSSKAPAEPQDEEASPEEDASAGVAERAKELVRSLLAALEAEGRVGAAAEAGEEEQARVRLAVGCALLKLARVGQLLRVEGTLGPLGWHTLGLLMHDPDVSVRADFAKKITAEQLRVFQADKKATKLGAPAPYLVTRSKGLPPHYTPLLALAALDPDKENLKAAKAALCQLVARWRQAADKHNLPRVLPEAQLPWLIHTLAHHPDYEEEEAAMEDADGGDDDGEGSEGTLPSAQRCLDFYINACLAGGANGFDLLRHVVGMVKVAIDRADPNGQQTRILAAVARALIDYRGTSKKWSASPVPPGLLLPSLLFGRPGGAHELHADVNMLPANFAFVEGLKNSASGFGVANAPGGATAERRASAERRAGSAGAIVAYDESIDGGSKGRKRASSTGSGGSPTKRVQGLPSPLLSPESGDAPPKKQKHARKARAAEADDDDDDDDDDDEQRRQEEEAAKAALQRCEREERNRARTARLQGSGPADDDDDVAMEEAGGSSRAGSSRSALGQKRAAAPPPAAAPARAASKSKSAASKNTAEPTRPQKAAAAPSKSQKAAAAAPPKSQKAAPPKSPASPFDFDEADAPKDAPKGKGATGKGATASENRAPQRATLRAR